MHSIPLLFMQIRSLKDFFHTSHNFNKFRQKTRSKYSHFTVFVKHYHFFFTNRKLDFWESFRTEKRQNMMKFFLSSGVKQLEFEMFINLICFKSSSSMSKIFHRFIKAWFKNFTAMLLPLILGDGFLWQCVSY